MQTLTPFRRENIQAQGLHLRQRHCRSRAWRSACRLGATLNSRTALVFRVEKAQVRHAGLMHSCCTATSSLSVVAMVLASFGTPAACVHCDGFLAGLRCLLHLKRVMPGLDLRFSTHCPRRWRIGSLSWISVRAVLSQSRSGWQRCDSQAPDWPTNIAREVRQNL